MPRLSAEKLRRMRNKYDHGVAKYLAACASAGSRITYGQLSGKFGGIARGWGDVLGGIALRCRDAGYPVLPVIVVSADTGMPSVDAVLYEDLGIVGEEAVRAEQARCFAMDWTKTPLG